jgi:energy-coupling factor transporter transmembrane protein EcfT
MVGGLFCLFCLITYTDIYLHDLVPCCDKRNNFPDKTILCTIVCIVVLFLLAFVLSVLTFVLSVLTFVLSVLTSVLPVLTFVLSVLTFVLPVLAFVLSVLLQLTVSDYYHFGIFNIFLDLTVNICRKLPTTSKSMANFTIPGCIKHVSGLDYVIVVNNTAMHVNHYFNNNMAVSLIGGGNRSMQRKNYIPTASYEQT